MLIGRIMKIRVKIGRKDMGDWIPISERLPSEAGEYLVTVKGYSHLPGNYVKTAFGVQLKDSQGFYCCPDVLAWMPMPEPYKEEY